jgi:tripartite-type tricarboxylate transporter receptor subunit TctC
MKEKDAAMTMSRLRLRSGSRAALGLVAFIAALAIGGAPAPAAWPERAVTIVVPYAAGGNTDTMARIAAQELQKVYAAPFIVENVVGAGGGIATQKVARAAGDGYTLLFATTAQLSILPNMQKVSYDPDADFVPIDVFGQSFSVLAVNAGVPAKDLGELVAYARQNPGKINYGSGGVGTVGHLVSASFAQRAGIDIVHVPYKGGSQATSDLLAGQIQMYFGNSVELLPFYNSDSIRLLAVGTTGRNPRYPDIPSVSEFYPGFSMPAWNGFVAPRNTLGQIVDALAERLRVIIASPEIADRLRTIGVEPGGPARQEMKAYLRQELIDYRTAVAAAGIARQP